MKNTTKGKISLLVTIISTCMIVVLAMGGTLIKISHNEDGTSSSSEFKIEIPDITKTSDSMVEGFVRSSTFQRNRAGERLVLQLQNTTTTISNTQKAGITELLGNMRFIKAVPILVEKINFKGRFESDQARLILNPTLTQQDPTLYVSRAALESVGEPASKYIIGILGKSPSKLPANFVSSRADGFAEVLYGIDGSHYGLLKLQDRQQATTDPKVKAQYQIVIDRFKKMVAQMK